MLILSRKRQEAVVVSGSSGIEPLLKVTVLDVRQGCVKLGFEASNEVPIHRAEVWERIREEKRNEVNTAASPNHNSCGPNAASK